MYTYKNLENISYKEITECFNLAFSDYQIPVQLTEEQLITRLVMSGVDKHLSFGAFYNEQMVGFIFNSCNVYNGDRVVFDVGTGVVPQHRGNKVFTNLYKFAEQQLIANNIEKYFLEVLQQNDKAIHSYKKQSFSVVREFSVLKLSKQIKGNTNDNVNIIDISNFDFDSVNHCILINPSFEHCTSLVKLNYTQFSVAYTQKENKKTAFCIFTKDNGEIIQLGYTDINDLKSIVQFLSSKFDLIYAKNIDMAHSNILKILKDLGFCEIAKQYEMAKKLVE